MGIAYTLTHVTNAYACAQMLEEEIEYQGLKQTIRENETNVKDLITYAKMDHSFVTVIPDLTLALFEFPDTLPRFPTLGVKDPRLSNERKETFFRAV